METKTMCLLIGLYVCVASAKPPETVPFCNITPVEYGSPATVRVSMEGLQERTKKGLAVRVFHESSNSSGNRNYGEILFCAWTEDIQQNKTPCSSTKANYEFVGIVNDTFILKIKSTSVQEDGIYVLTAHAFKTNKCRLKLSFTAETVPFCNITPVEYGSPATLRVSMEGLQERAKKGLAVRVFHESSNSSGNREDGEILFCAWTEDIQQNKTPCSFTKANYEFVGIVNDTFILKIQSTSIQEDGMYVLTAHAFKTNKCRLKLSFTETTTRQNTVAASNVPSNRSAVKDTPQATDDTPDRQMIAGICSGIIVTVICVALLYFRKRVKNCFPNCQRKHDGTYVHQEPGTDIEAGSLPQTLHVSVPSLHAEENQLDNAPPQQQEAERSGDRQNHDGRRHDLERAPADVQLTSPPETAPLLSGPRTQNGATVAGQDDDQLVTHGHGVFDSLQQEMSPNEEKLSRPRGGFIS